MAAFGVGLLTLQGAYVLWYNRPDPRERPQDAEDAFTMVHVEEPVSERTVWRNVHIFNNNGNGLSLPRSAHMDIDGLRSEGNSGDGIIVR